MSNARTIGPSVVSSTCSRARPGAVCGSSTPDMASCADKGISHHQPAGVEAGVLVIGNHTRQPPTRYDGDTVRERQQFIEIRRDQEDGDAACGDLADAAPRSQNVLV